MNMIHLSSIDRDVVVQELCISLAEKFGCECQWFAFGSDTILSYLGATAMRQYVM